MIDEIFHLLKEKISEDKWSFVNKKHKKLKKCQDQKNVSKTIF